MNNKQSVAPNLLQQNFTAMTPNSRWVADISYTHTLEEWLYIDFLRLLFA